MIDLKQIHKFSACHEFKVKNSEVCGCFYCTQFFLSEDIEEWVNDDFKDGRKGKTALCPKCGIDSVLPEVDDFTLNLKLLEDMNAEYFARTRFIDD